MKEHFATCAEVTDKQSTATKVFLQLFGTRNHVSKQLVMKFMLQLHKLPKFLERIGNNGCSRKSRTANLDFEASYVIEPDEKCRRRRAGIQPVLKELGFIERKNVVEDPTWYRLNQGYVIDVTTMNLSDGLVQSKCEKMLNGPKPQVSHFVSI